MPKVSVVMPTYNASAYIRTTLDSIFSQSLTDFECLVIDDGSTDNTAEIVAGYQGSHIQLISQPNSGGPATPRNKGISRATGEYIFMFDSGDVMLPNKLQASCAALDAHPQADILFTNFQSIDEVGEVLNANYLQNYETLWRLLPTPDTEISLFESAVLFNALIRVNFIGTSSVVLRRSALGTEDVFNESMKNSDDRLFWTRFIKSHKAIFLNRVLHQYRILDTGISRQSFIKRAPAKIRGLEYIRELCETPEQKCCINRQIADDYAALSYVYRRQGEHTHAMTSAFRALTWGVNRNTLRALATSMMAPLIRKAK